MANKNSTKRTLFGSVMALLLCCTMLLGTTFAWFTDSATSGSNVIKAGNLDIDVQYTTDGESWASLDGADNLFNKDVLWEPGHTEVVALKIENKGSLALKYAANMNIVEETVGKTKDSTDIKLSEILTVSTLVQQANDSRGVGNIALDLAFDGENKVFYENTAAFNAANVLRNDVELLPGDSHYMIVKVDMAETVGNEANHNGENVPSINFGINVMATQLPYESDSFDNQYDAGATYPDYEYPSDLKAEVSKIVEPVVVKANNKDYTLDTAYTFKALDDVEAAKTSPYRYWHADFVVSVDKDIPEGTLVGLAGQYDSWNENWLAFTTEAGFAADTEFRLLEDYGNIYINYEELCNSVKEFNCGAFAEKDTDGNSKIAGTKLTVELRLYETTADPTSDAGDKNIETGKYKVIGQYSYTF